LKDDAKGIDKLSAFLRKRGFDDGGGVETFLRRLQSLRSKGAAHRKGSDYQKALDDLGLAAMNHRKAFRHLLHGALRCLEALEYLCEIEAAQRGSIATLPRGGL
jgi:hypothetical protein